MVARSPKTMSCVGFATPSTKLSYPVCAHHTFEQSWYTTKCSSRDLAQLAGDGKTLPCQLFMVYGRRSRAVLLFLARLLRSTILSIRADTNSILFSFPAKVYSHRYLRGKLSRKMTAQIHHGEHEGGYSKSIKSCSSAELRRWWLQICKYFLHSSSTCVSHVRGHD